MQLFNVTGIMLSYFVNYGIEINMAGENPAKWRIPFALQMLPGAILLAGIVTQNESPRWLVEKNRHADAQHALSHVRGRPQDDPEVLRELQEIIEDFQGREKLPLFTQIKGAFENKRIFYQTSFGIVLMFWQQWTGTNRYV